MRALKEPLQTISSYLKEHPIRVDFHPDHFVLLNSTKIVGTWQTSKLPIKIHISSPKSQEEFRAHADFIDLDMFKTFLQTIQGTVPEIHCMIEAKQKDGALFELSNQLGESDFTEQINQSSFLIK